MEHRTDAKYKKLLAALPKAIQTKHEGMKMSMPAKKSEQIKSTQAKSACAKPAEEEEDEFDRAISRAAEAGAFDEMIAQAVQDYHDGKTTLVSDRYKKTGSG